MRTIIGACLVMAATSILGAGQEKPRLTDDEGRILALETAWNHAEQNKDVAALDQFLAATLVYVDYDGSLQNKAQSLTDAKSESLHPEQITNDEMTTHVYGDAAVSGRYIIASQWNPAEEVAGSIDSLTPRPGRPMLSPSEIE